MEDITSRQLKGQIIRDDVAHRGNSLMGGGHEEGIAPLEESLQRGDVGMQERHSLTCLGCY